MRVSSEFGSPNVLQQNSYNSNCSYNGNGYTSFEASENLETGQNPRFSKVTHNKTWIRKNHLSRNCENRGPPPPEYVPYVPASISPVIPKMGSYFENKDEEYCPAPVSENWGVTENDTEEVNKTSECSEVDKTINPEKLKKLAMDFFQKAVHTDDSTKETAEINTKIDVHENSVTSRRQEPVEPALIRKCYFHKNFHFDEDGFLETHVHGNSKWKMNGLASATKVSGFGIWFSDTNEL